MNGPHPAEAGDFRMLLLVLTLLLAAGGVVAWAGSRPAGASLDELVAAVAPGRSN